MTTKETIPLTDLPQPQDTTRRDQWGRYLVLPPDTTAAPRAPQGYTRATTVAKVLDDGGGLMAWKAAMVATGMVMRRGLRTQWETLVAQHPVGGPWYGGTEAKKDARRLVEECAAVGGANDRSEVGTALHTLTALVDVGKNPTVSPELQRDLATYLTALDTHGVEVVDGMVEVCTVLDDWKVAGTFDRLVTVPGFDLPLIADLKTGRDLSYSWHSIAVQLAIYAHGDAIYEQGWATDGSEDGRLSMPAVDQQYALVIWLNADAEGEAECTLHLVNIKVGWEAFEHAMWTREYRKQELHSDLGLVPIPTTNENVEAHLAASLLAELKPLRDDLQHRIDVIGAHAQARQALVDGWPSDIPSLRGSLEHTQAQLAGITLHVDAVERAHGLIALDDGQALASVVDLFAGEIVHHGR